MSNPELAVPIGSTEVGLRLRGGVATNLAAVTVGNVLVHGVIASGVTPIGEHGPQLTYAHHYVPNGDRSDSGTPTFIDDKLVSYKYDAKRDHKLDTASYAEDELVQESNQIFHKVLDPQEVTRAYNDASVASQLRQEVYDSVNTFVQEHALRNDDEINILLKIRAHSSLDDVGEDGEVFLRTPEYDLYDAPEALMDGFNHTISEQNPAFSEQMIADASHRSYISLNYETYSNMQQLTQKYDYKSLGNMLEAWKYNKSTIPKEVKDAFDHLQDGINEEVGSLELTATLTHADYSGMPKDAQVCLVPVSDPGMEMQSIDATIPLVLPFLLAVPFARKRRLSISSPNGNSVQTAPIPSRKQRRMVKEGRASVRDRLEVECYDKALETKATVEDRVRQVHEARLKRLPKREGFRIPRLFWAVNVGFMALSGLGVGLAYEHRDKSSGNKDGAVAIDSSREPCDSDMRVLQLAPQRRVKIIPGK